MSKKSRRNLEAELAAVAGRPKAVEGEDMVLGNDMLASMVSPTQGGVYFLSIDEIIRRKGWSIYDEMQHDDQVKVCMEFKKTLVLGRTWEIAPKSEDDPNAVAQAEFAKRLLERLPMSEVWKNMASAFDYGFSLAEIVWKRDVDEDGSTKLFVDKLAFKKPSQIHLKADIHGNFLGAKQTNTMTQIGPIEVDAQKLLLYTHDKKFGNLYGNPDLRAGYRAWFAKKFVIQFWNVYLERFGAPMTKVTYPQGASDDLKNNLKKLLSNLGSKTEVLVPDGVEINLIEATRGGNAGYVEALSFHNNSIARAILMVALLGANGDEVRASNGDSQSFLHLRILFKMADVLSKQISGALMEQVVCRALDLNFPVAAHPKFIWQDYGQYEGMKVADEIRQLWAAGLIDADQDDVNYIRSVVGLPIRDEDHKDKLVRPAAIPPPGNANAPPPPANQGNDRAGKGGAADTPPKP